MPENKTSSESARQGTDVAQWVPAHGDVLYRFAMMRIRDVSVAEELVQETFLAALKGLSSFQGQSSVRTWLIGILKHKIIDHLRRADRETQSDDIEAEADAYFDEHGRWAVAPSVLENPVSRTEQREIRKRLTECIEALPERLSQVFVLTQMDDLDTREACKVLDVTSTNLWVMLHRARLRLRQCLEQKGFGQTT